MHIFPCVYLFVIQYQLNQIHLYDLPILAIIADRVKVVVCKPERVAEKLLKHSEALGGVDRFTFQMDNAGLTHEQLMRSIELIGTKVIPLVQ